MFDSLASILLSPASSTESREHAKTEPALFISLFSLLVPGCQVLPPKIIRSYNVTGVPWHCTWHHSVSSSPYNRETSLHLIYFLINNFILAPPSTKQTLLSWPLEHGHACYSSRLVVYLLPAVTCICCTITSWHNCLQQLLQSWNAPLETHSHKLEWHQSLSSMEFTCLTHKAFSSAKMPTHVLVVGTFRAKGGSLLHGQTSSCRFLKNLINYPQQFLKSILS